METHVHDNYTGHCRIKLIEFSRTHLSFEIARANLGYVEVTYDLDATRFAELQRVVGLIFGLQR